MKIISWNVNGLRAVYKRNFLDWFKKTDADIVCLQETKAHQEQLPGELIDIDGYYSFFNSAERKGYSSVAIYTKQKPLKIERELGLERFDQEGRLLKLTYANFIILNLYLPQGGRNKENFDYKFETYDYLLRYLEKNKNKNIILGGDFNIAHNEIDLARPKGNKNNTGFTPEERNQIEKITSLGFEDTFRKFNKEDGNYTWWSYMHNARPRNIGWRIDYFFAAKSITPNLKNAFILEKVMGSDHCPIGIDIQI